MTTETSALEVTVVVDVEVVAGGFGSVVEDVTLAVFEMVAPVAPGLMWTVIENVAEPTERTMRSCR